MKPTGLLSLMVMTGLLVIVPAARAATVSGEVIFNEGAQGSAYRFATEAGERSTVTVERTGPTLRFHDDTAPVKAGPLCRQVDDKTAECGTAGDPSVVGVSVLGGDADDVLSVTTLDGPQVVLDGNGGADDLRGGPGEDTLVGGSGSDRLGGGGGNDDLHGDGAPRDLGSPNGVVVVSPTSVPLGGDTIDGGAGYDEASYADHTAAVSVDLALAGNGNGVAGEGDSLANVEGVTGGSGDDTLSGDGAGNSLAGGDGDDTLLGRGGGDQLTGGGGEDRLDAGAGNDTLEPVDGEGDDLRCGSGSDSIYELLEFDESSEELVHVGPDAADGVHQDCELAYVDPAGGFDVTLNVKTRALRLRRGRTLVVPNPCRFRADDLSRRSRCRATVAVRSRAGSDKKLTRRVRSTRAATVRVRLSGGIARAARRGRVAIAFRIVRKQDDQAFTWKPKFTALLD